MGAGTPENESGRADATPDLRLGSQGMNATTQARKTATTDDEPDEYRVHDTDEECVTVECRDCVWTNSNPPLRAIDFADAHEDRHGHEVSR